MQNYQNTYVYCPTDESMQAGVCCSSDVLYRCISSFGYCTNTTASSYLIKQWLCPFESLCGETWDLVASENASYIELSNPSNFSVGKMCHYKISFPSGSSTNDKINIIVDAKYSTN